MFIQRTHQATSKGMIEELGGGGVDINNQCQIYVEFWFLLKTRSHCLGAGGGGGGGVNCLLKNTENKLKFNFKDFLFSLGHTHFFWMIVHETQALYMPRMWL